MNKTTFFTFLYSLSFFISIAQKKKDLLVEIESLKSELNTINTELANSQKNEKVSAVKLSSFEEQIRGLKETNARLLNNINTLTEASKRESQNVGKTLESLREKENQIKLIGDALAQIDSLKLVRLTQIQTRLGDSLPVKLVNASIVISIPNVELFGDPDKNFKIAEKGKTKLEQLSQVLIENPEMQVTIQGNSNAITFEDTVIDNWDLSARQAASVIRILQNDFQISQERITVTAMSEYATSGIETVTRFIIEPDYVSLYNILSEQMKNQF